MMKTAEQWRDENKCVPFPHLAVLTVEQVKAIQLDAWKQGMADAANTLIPAYPNEIQRAEIERAFDCGIAAHRDAIHKEIEKKDHEKR